MNRQDLDLVGQMLADIQETFNLPTFDLVKVCERNIHGRPWKRIIQNAKGDANEQRIQAEGTEIVHRFRTTLTKTR